MLPYHKDIARATYQTIAASNISEAAAYCTVVKHREGPDYFGLHCHGTMLRAMPYIITIFYLYWERSVINLLRLQLSTSRVYTRNITAQYSTILHTAVDKNDLSVLYEDLIEMCSYLYVPSSKINISNSVGAGAISGWTYFLRQDTFPATSGNVFHTLKCSMSYTLALNISILSHVSMRRQTDPCRSMVWCFQPPTFYGIISHRGYCGKIKMWSRRFCLYGQEHWTYQLEYQICQ